MWCLLVNVGVRLLANHVRSHWKGKSLDLVAGCSFIPHRHVTSSMVAQRGNVLGMSDMIGMLTCESLQIYLELIKNHIRIEDESFFLC